MKLCGMKRFKYIHVFYTRDREAKFNPRIVEMIHNPQNHFDINEHLFITGYRKVYEAICQYPNTELVDVEKPNSAEVLNQYAERGDWFILHCLPAATECLKLKREIWSRVVWRTWGGDIGYFQRVGKPYGNLKNKLWNLFFVRQVRSFKVVGVSRNPADEISITRRFGPVKKMMQFGYPRYGKDEILKKISENHAVNHKGTKIMLGHSGYVEDNHIQLLERMSAYRRQDLTIYLMLSYGDKEYLPRVKQYAAETWGEKAVFIEQFMDYETYAELIADMDIAIFDGLNSYALGNIKILKFFQKKIYLNKAGVLRKAFDREGLPYALTEDIGKAPFDEFISPMEYPALDSSSSETSYERGVRHWHELLDYLEQG